MLKKPAIKTIGVFDSGFGGINILKAIVKELPHYNYLYLGDTARVPYGSRSQEVIFEFVKQAVDFMFAHGCELAILACNTASSDALRRIQQEYLPRRYPGKKVLGVLIPAAEEAALKTKNNRVGVIATEGTVKSGAFLKELNKINARIKVFQKACSLLVPIVEAGEHNSKAAELILQNYLAPLKNKNIDTLILGCTHYGILEAKIKKILGKRVTVISEARAVPERLADYLKRHPEVEKSLGKDGKRDFFTTDLTLKFAILGSKFFGQKIAPKKAVLI